MPRLGMDSWLPPDQNIIDNATKAMGKDWYGGYVGGNGLYLGRPWPKSSWQLLKDNDIAPLPIYVPAQSLNGEHPIACADQAMTLVEQNGMTGLVCVDTESSMRSILNFETWVDLFVNTVVAAHWIAVVYGGAHYFPSDCFKWEVLWGQPAVVPSHNAALQYGPYSQMGFSFDADNAGDGFPFAQWIGAVIPPIAPPIVPPINQPTTKEQEYYYSHAHH